MPETADNKQLDKEGRWQLVGSPEPEVVPVVEEPKPKEPKPLLVGVGWRMRLHILADWRLWRWPGNRTPSKLWYARYTTLQRRGRIVASDCADKKCGWSGQRLYGNENPGIVQKCLKCGAEKKLKKIHNWDPRD